MKFLIFSPYYPPHTGGLESHSEEFNKELIRLGNEVSVFTPKIPTISPSEEVFDGIRIIRYPAFEIVSNYPFPKFWDPLFWKQLFTLKQNSNPDIIIIRTRFFFLSFIGLMFAKRYSLPCVHIEHGSDFVKLANPLSSALAYIYDQIFGRIVFKYSTLNISISEAVHSFVKKFDKRDSPIIYRGLDFSQLDSAEMYTPDALSPYRDRTILVTAARLYKWKGIERTIKAIKLLTPDERDKIIFVVVGDGEDRTRLETLSQGLPVVFLGKLSRIHTIGFLKTADIYIHSSFPGGGLSTSLLEAMYCNCAVIATPHEGAQEVIIDLENGLLLKSDDFTDSIRALITNKSTQRALSQNAKESILRKFSWDKSITRYLTYFQKL